MEEKARKKERRNKCKKVTYAKDKLKKEKQVERRRRRRSLTSETGRTAHQDIAFDSTPHTLQIIIN